MKKLLVIVLALTFVVGMTGMVFAEADMDAVQDQTPDLDEVNENWGEQPGKAEGSVGHMNPVDDGVVHDTQDDCGSLNSD